MADLSRVGDLEVKIVGSDGITPADVVTIDSTNSLAVSIAGSQGFAVTLSIANKSITALATSLSGWTTVIDETTPVGYTWYLKSLVVSVESSSLIRALVGPSGSETTQFQLRVDAGDSFQIDAHGFQMVENNRILIEMDAGGVGKEIIGNLVIYEEEN